MQNRETILRLLVICLLAYMLVSYGAARLRLDALRAEGQELDCLRTELTAANERLRSELASLYEDETVAALARDRLGLAIPGERIYYFD